MADRGMGALEYRPVLEHATGEDDIDLAQLYQESRRYTSDLPGDVIATVTEPVYDSATGEHVLIPQGARLLGRYNNQVNYGQNRVQVVWQRVILPDTSSFQLDNLVRTDAAGYAGLEDGIDWHWDRIGAGAGAGAAMTSLLGIGAELAAPANRTDGDRVIIALACRYA
ncbi:hypothetical protein PSEUDO8O_31027 [Pseudomonas sp. 8O]|nr:hypothetical protein PSEUDO8O_31027 [Pseudomonas sp. 8O]